MFLGESHKMFYIAKVRGEIARTITKDSSDGNIYFDTPEWSTHPDYAAVVASPKLVEPPFDVYLYRIHDDSLMKVLDGNYYWPHLWVEGGDKIPVARKQSAVIKTQVSLYPTGNILHISGISGTKAVLSVNDLKGSTICSYTITNNTRQIALKVQQGVYTAVIKEKGSVTVVKSIIIS